LHLPEAKRGTQILRAFDPQLLAGFDPHMGYDFATGRRLHSGCYTIWGISQSLGRVPLLPCENPDGSPQAAPVPWEWWVAQLAEMREGPLACERAAKANEQLQASIDAEEEARISEVASLYIEGGERNRTEDLRDITDAVNRQVYGQKPAPRGQIISLPGEKR
jgi:hypothetical protein